MIELVLSCDEKLPDQTICTINFNSSKLVYMAEQTSLEIQTFKATVPLTVLEVNLEDC